MIGQLRSVVFDCPDPHRLAAFWAEVLGGALAVEEPDWVVVTDPSGRRLAFQRSPDHRPPRFPDAHASQQIHLDIVIDGVVDDVDAAEREVLRLGGTRVPDAVGEDRFRVFRDPAGHPFCLVWGVGT